MLILDLILLQQGPVDPGIMNFVFIGAMLAIFWLFMIRPQAKKQKEQTQFADALQKGAEVVTTSGILGRITKIEGDVVTLEISGKTYMRILRSAISKEMTDGLKGDSK